MEVAKSRELFAKFIRENPQFGHVYTHQEANQSINRRFDSYVTLLDQIRVASSSERDVVFGHLDDMSVNAFACLWKDQGLIAINHGALLTIYVVLQRMLSDAEALPKLGDPKEERSDLPHLDGLTIDWDKLSPNILQAMPRNQMRGEYFAVLLEIAMRFLLAHEYAHLYNGHISFIEGEFKQAVLPEFARSDLIRPDYVTSQALELDADKDAMGFLLSTMLDRYLHRSEAPQGTEEMWEFPRAVFMVAFAVYVVFRIFSWGSKANVHSSHPHPLHRLRCINGAFYVAFDSSNEFYWKSSKAPFDSLEGEAEADRLFTDIVDQAEHAFQRILGPAYTYGSVTKAEYDNLEYSTLKAFDRLEELKPILEAHRWKRPRD